MKSFLSFLSFWEASVVLALGATAALPGPSEHLREHLYDTSERGDEALLENVRHNCDQHWNDGDLRMSHIRMRLVRRHRAAVLQPSLDRVVASSAFAMSSPHPADMTSRKTVARSASDVRETSGFFPQRDTVLDDDSAMQALIAKFHSTTREEKWMCAEDLGNYPKALDVLLTAFPEADIDLSLFVAKSLAQIGDPRAIGPLLEKWRRAPRGSPGKRYIPDALAAVREEAAGALARLQKQSDPERGKRPSESAATTEATGKTSTDPARLARIRAASMPAITKPVLFHTPEADAVLSALEVFPPDNPWNQLVDEWPLHPNSEAIIASIGTDKPLRYNPDMCFVLVPPDQKRLEVKIRAYPGESDPGPYPVPGNIPIEGWPAYYHQFHDGKIPTLDEVQRGTGGDRHGIVVDPVNRMLYEFFMMRRTDRGWEAAQASVFDLKTNKLRPQGWTSADAAGLPIFPAVVRYDEIQRGVVEHALRVTVRKTRREFVAPATHYASRHTNPQYPRMGERIRLKADFDISGFSPPVAAILKALKRYGMFVADNGIEWAVSVTPDPRIPNLHDELRRVRGRAFEVVVAPE